MSLNFPSLALFLRVVLTHDSVNKHVYFLEFFLLTAASSVDGSVGPFSEYIPGNLLFFKAVVRRWLNRASAERKPRSAFNCAHFKLTDDQKRQAQWTVTLTS